jgi:NitT/TauT family transport system substrate-binding protein
MSETVRIGTIVWPGNAAFYLAEQKGFFQQVGVNVELKQFSSFAAAEQAYNAGRLSGLATSLNGILSLTNEDRPMKAVMVIDYSRGADGIVARKGINKIEQLRGKKIGVGLWAVGSYILARALEKGKLKADELQIINITRPEGEEAFLRGEIDALVTYEPSLSYLSRQTQAKVIFTSREIPGEIVDVFCFDEMLLRLRRDVCRRVLAAYFRAVAYWNEHPEEANAVLLQQIGTGTTPEELKSLLAGIDLKDRSENVRLLGTSASPGPIIATAERLLSLSPLVNSLKPAGVKARFDFDLVHELG